MNRRPTARAVFSWALLVSTAVLAAVVFGWAVGFGLSIGFYKADEFIAGQAAAAAQQQMEVESYD